MLPVKPVANLQNDASYHHLVGLTASYQVLVRRQSVTCQVLVRLENWRIKNQTKTKSMQKDHFALPSLITALDLERFFFSIAHFPIPLLLLPEVLTVSRDCNELELWF